MGSRIGIGGCAVGVAEVGMVVVGIAAGEGFNVAPALEELAVENGREVTMTPKVRSRRIQVSSLR